MKDTDKRDLLAYLSEQENVKETYIYEKRLIKET